MARKITIIQGHPDPAENRFCHALADAYAKGAAEAGHEIRKINVGKLGFPWLRTFDEFYKDPPPAAILPAQEAIAWADHLVMIFPLWLGTEPALVKAFLEQTIRPGFAWLEAAPGSMKKKKLLSDKSARIVITMGMPAFFYRWFFLFHGFRCHTGDILKFVGVGPVRESLIGLMMWMKPEKGQKWLERMVALGRRGL